MARMVYIKEICPDSWLHWSPRGGSSCLRDFRQTPTSKTYCKREKIEELLKKPGNFWEMAPPGMDLTKVIFWREQQWLKNVESRLIKLERRERLLKIFSDGMKTAELKVIGLKELLAKGSQREVTIALDRWKAAFEHIVDNREEFNHWDHDDASRWQSEKTGIGWTSLMLEHSRCDGCPGWIETGEDNLDFSLLTMELCLGLSSKDNRLQPKTKGSVRLDGMGIKRDGSICILEVKGPQDGVSLVDAFLQAVCGALAVHAKREMILKLAKSPCGRRPEACISISKTTRTLGVYVFMSRFKGRREMFCWDKKLETYAPMVFEGFPQLREAAFFQVQPELTSMFRKLTPFKVLRPSG